VVEGVTCVEGVGEELGGEIAPEKMRYHISMNVRKFVGIQTHKVDRGEISGHFGK